MGFSIFIDLCNQHLNQFYIFSIPKRNIVPCSGDTPFLPPSSPRQTIYLQVCLF